MNDTTATDPGTGKKTDGGASAADGAPAGRIRVEEAPKPPLKQRFQNLLLEYGKVAITIHFTLFGLVVAGFWLALKFGFAIDGVSGTAGTLGAAFLASQATKPIRWAATLVLTPIVARFIGYTNTKAQPPAAKDAE